MNFSLSKTINYCLFIATYALLAFTDALCVARGVKGGAVVSLKYVTMLAGIALMGAQILLRGHMKVDKQSVIYRKETYKVLFVAMIFLLISSIEILINSRMTSNTWGELIKLILPVIYALCILNTFDFKGIYNCMVVLLFIMIAGYILEVGTQTFTVANLNKINFINSYSAFESSYFAAPSTALCTYFMYYRDKKIYKYVSLIFVILVFKRLSIVFALILLFLPRIIDVNKKISRVANTILKCFFVCITYLYMWLLMPGGGDFFRTYFGVSKTSFTMGRSEFLKVLINRGYMSYGFGSSTDFLGYSIEMDFIKIGMELTIIGLIIFIWVYFDFAGRNLYCVIYMSFIFLSLVTSHSLTSDFGWTLNYLIFGSILYKQTNDLSYLKYEKRKKRRKRNSKINKKIIRTAEC